MNFFVSCGEKKPETTETTEASAPALSPELEKGAELFAQNCASCHGEKGLGDGPAGNALNPKPRNYKSPAAEWKNGPTEAGITKTLNNGIAGGAMVGYKHLGPDNIKALTEYVIYLSKN